MEIDNVITFKVALFNRYQTVDVLRAMADSGPWREIGLCTRNDDSIVFDLLSVFPVHNGDASHRIHFAGGLLGQWAVYAAGYGVDRAGSRVLRGRRGRGV